MPTYDYHCPACGRDEERVSPMAMRHEQTCGCGAALEMVFRSSTAVNPDTFPGGRFVQENFGPEPETFYSKRAMALRAKELGLEPFVRHVEGDQHVGRWAMTDPQTLANAAALLARIHGGGA